MDDIGSLYHLVSGEASVGCFIESLYEGWDVVELFIVGNRSYGSKGCITSSIDDMVIFIGDSDDISYVIIVEEVELWRVDLIGDLSCFECDEFRSEVDIVFLCGIV